MFYCDDCAEIKGYPITMFKSSGNCEICNTPAICNEGKSSDLPVPELEPDLKPDVIIIGIGELTDYAIEVIKKLQVEGKLGKERTWLVGKHSIKTNKFKP